MRSFLKLAALALMIGFGGILPAGAQDSYTQMPNGDSKDLVYGICSGCHSMKLVMQQGMSRKRWDKLLDWMVEKQGMAPLDAQTEEQVLDYLAQHFGEDQETGRPGVPSPFGTVRPLMPRQ